MVKSRVLGNELWSRFSLPRAKVLINEVDTCVKFKGIKCLKKTKIKNYSKGILSKQAIMVEEEQDEDKGNRSGLLKA